jgi:hypothetical protein
MKAENNYRHGSDIAQKKNRKLTCFGSVSQTNEKACIGHVPGYHFIPSVSVDLLLKRFFHGGFHVEMMNASA